MNKWRRAFVIFSDAGMGDYDLSAEHDVVYVHCPSIHSTSEFGKELKELGWHKDENRDRDDPNAVINEEASWYHYC